ncbi:hypothetical protein F5884DRAFT_864617 [Xylogone sp. PMI_703]|nr:hypothetical protein F5884DRAFT_864617 [Xylogone sp. PMI_703]
MGRIIRSTKCANCRKRKIKCDEGLPACSQCSRAGWICPGYHNEVGVAFRDQTASVVSRQEKRRAALSRKAILSDETSNEDADSNTDTSITKASATNANVCKVTQNNYALNHSIDRTGSSTRADADQSIASRPTAYHSILQPALSTNLEDQAISFFFGHYVLPIRHGNHEYLPDIYAEEVRDEFDGPIKNIITASGLAGLANRSNNERLLVVARRLYGKAIGLINSALADPVKVKSDQTLAAVLVLSIFEAITSSDEAAMQAWSYHILGAINLIEIRGPEQFTSERSLRMFLQLRRLVVLACHQLRLPYPFVVQKWMAWAEYSQPPDELPANRLVVLNENLTATRAWLKANNITDPFTIATKLISVDETLRKWADTLPYSWQPITYDIPSRSPSLLTQSSSPSTFPENRAKRRRYNNNNDNETNSPRSTSTSTSSSTSNSTTDSKYNTSYDGTIDLYPDLWIASIWNNYRASRILIHETILSSTLSNAPSPGTPSYLLENMIFRSSSVLRDMTTAVCRSVYFHMNSCSQDIDTDIDIDIDIAPDLESPRSQRLHPTMPPNATHMSGTYLLIWPLYMAGLLRTTPVEQRAWLADKLEVIGWELGNRQAVRLSAALREVRNETFIHTKEWYGEESGNTVEGWQESEEGVRYGGTEG